MICSESFTILFVIVRSGEYQKSTEDCLNIVNNALYLILFLDGGLEFAIASLAMQILIGIYHSQDEFRKGNYLEAAGHLGMAMIRGNQLARQIEMLSLKYEIESIKASLVQKSESSLGRYKLSTTTIKAKSALFPDDVLVIYRKYKNMDLQKIITKGAEIHEISLLLKYHLVRPDESGVCCKILVDGRGGVPLELIQKCLPDRQFLSENPKYIDDLLNSALLNWQSTPNVIAFFSDREAVKDCSVRDAYFMDWYQHELKMAGARPEEGLHDFLKRASRSSQEIPHLLAKFPFEVKRLCGYPNILVLPSEMLDHYSLSYHQPVITKYEHALIALKYKISKPIYYSKTLEKTSAEPGFAGQLIAGMGNLLSFGERGEYLLMELLQRTFPTEEYRILHNKQEQIAFLNFCAFHAAHCGQNKPDQAVRVFRFLSGKGIDLNEIATNTKHVHVRKFLQDHELLD